MMDQEIIEVPYSDNVSSQVITIDLPPQSSGPDSQDGVQTIELYAPGVTTTTMTQLQSSETVAQLDCNHQQQLEVDSKYGSNGKTNDCSLAVEDHHLMNEHDNVGIISSHPIGDNISNDIHHQLPDNNLLKEEQNTQQQQQLQLQQQLSTRNDPDENHTNGNGSLKTQTRFKWTKEKSQVAMNLVKHGCKPKLVSVAVGCSLRTAQKFVETVTPKMEGESFKNYEIRRRGRKSKDVNHRLEAIKEVLSKDSTKTQVEIAADLKVSNTTVCRDLKRIGASWREKKNTDQTGPSKRETKKERQSIIKKSPSSPTKSSKAKNKPKKSPS